MAENKKASRVEPGTVEATVVLCGSAAFGLGKALKPETVLGVLCSDESTEQCDVRNNGIIYSEVPPDILFGRSIMISADLLQDVRQQLRNRLLKARCDGVRRSPEMMRPPSGR